MLSIPPAGAKISIGWLKLRYNSFFVNTQILCPGGAALYDAGFSRVVLSLSLIHI